MTTAKHSEFLSRGGGGTEKGDGCKEGQGGVFEGIALEYPPKLQKGGAGGTAIKRMWVGVNYWLVSGEGEGRQGN